MRKLLILIRLNLINSLIERADMILYTLSNMVAPLTVMFVWLTFTPPGSTSVLPRNTLIWYFILAMFVKLFTSAWGGFFLSNRIRRGAISPYLLQPTPLVFHYLSNNIAEKIIKLIILIPALILLILVLKLPWFTTSAFLIVISFISLIMAAGIYFLIDVSLGLLAFWLDETSAINDLYGLLSVLFCGMLVPLSALPAVIRQISYFLPFRFTLSLPVEIILGQLNSFQITYSLLLQLFWFIVVLLIYHKLWLKGLKVYSAAGA